MSDVPGFYYSQGGWFSRKWAEQFTPVRGAEPLNHSAEGQGENSGRPNSECKSRDGATEFCGGGGVELRKVNDPRTEKRRSADQGSSDQPTATQLVSASQPAESIVDDGSAGMAGVGRGRWV